MKLSEITIHGDVVEITLDGTVMRFGGTVEHSVLMDRTGRLDIALAVVPHSTEPKVRPATPHRNTR